MSEFIYKHNIYRGKLQSWKQINPLKRCHLFWLDRFEAISKIHLSVGHIQSLLQTLIHLMRFDLFLSIAILIERVYNPLNSHELRFKFLYNVSDSFLQESIPLFQFFLSQSPFSLDIANFRFLASFKSTEIL